MPKVWDKHCERYIEYVPETGEIIGAVSSPNLAWRVPYNVVYFNGKQIKVCNFAWFVMTGSWPNKLIDHEDRNSLNDKWNNLRLVTYAQNGRNRTKSNKSKRLYLGVGWEYDAKWRYEFTIDGVRHRKSGYRCETKCALERDKHILRLGEKFSKLNILERQKWHGTQQRSSLSCLHGKKRYLKTT